MNLRHPSLLAGLGLLAGSLSANTVIYTQDFSSPSTLKDFQFQLGGNSLAASTKYITLGQFGSASNSGVNEAAAGNGTGVGAGNDISSVGVARPQDIRGTNARAVVTFLPASLFTHGMEYTVSFDVIGDELGNVGVASRYFLDFVHGYDLGDGAGSAATDAAIIADNSTNGFGDIAVGVGTPVFIAKGGATVVHVAEGEIFGTTTAITTANSFNFVYDGTNGADVALAFATFNNIYSLDNLTITAIPEPSTFAMLAGAFGVGVLAYRRRRS